MQQHRHILSSIEELRTELLAGESSPSQGRILVLRTGHIDSVVRDTLVNIAGVEGEFIDAHVLGKSYRPRGQRRRPRWWSWRYPEVAASPGQVPLYKPGDGQVLTISKMSIWLAGAVPILLVGHGTTVPGKREKQKVKLKHEDAVVSLSSTSGGGYGAMGNYMFPSSNRRTQMSSFEEDLWETLVLLGAGGADDVPIEELLAELIYERWTDCLSAMRLEISHADQEQKSLWRAMAALETNLDEAKYLARRGKQLDVASPAAWGDLVQRLQLRISLRQPGISAEIHRKQASLAAGPRAENDGSLDRIAYLGGLLLPMTVVASVLAIEGDYGPEGGNFWVFWVVSFIASMLALLIIYADQLRTVEVWFEIGDFDDEDEVEGEEGSGWETAKYLVQRWTDGSKGSTWRREQLGWGGAVKKMSGYYWWRRDPRLAFRRPGDVVRSRFV